MNRILPVTQGVTHKLLGVDDLLAMSEPMSQPEPGIYFLFSGDSLVYLGKSVQVISRVCSHAAAGWKVFDRWAWIPCPAADLDRVERAYLDVFLPPLNNDMTTRRLRGHPPQPNRDPIPLNPWASVPASAWEAMKQSVAEDDGPLECDIMADRMKRLRAMKVPNPAPIYFEDV